MLERDAMSEGPISPLKTDDKTDTGVEKEAVFRVKALRWAFQGDYRSRGRNSAAVVAGRTEAGLNGGTLLVRAMVPSYFRDLPCFAQDDIASGDIARRDNKSPVVADETIITLPGSGLVLLDQTDKAGVVYLGDAVHDLIYAA